MNEPRSIAYFTMEVGLDAAVPTYSGGLGVLAGDTIRAAADLKTPMVGITLLHRKGYFHQRLDPGGSQIEEPVAWVVEDFLHEMPQRAAVTIEGRDVRLRCWRYDLAGEGGFVVPVYFLDADLPENTEWDRTLTHYLYVGDPHYRFCQEVILGVGGVRKLRALGYDRISRYHMNEGHAALLTLELLDEEARKAGREVAHREDLEAVREKCIFTTHTPVPAGLDQFPIELVGQVIGPRRDFLDLHDNLCRDLLGRVFQHPAPFRDFAEVVHGGTTLNMALLALNLSRYVNGVAKKHAEVSRHLFAGYAIDAITNGVHAATWASQPFRDLFDRYIPGWRKDNFSLRSALGIPRPEIWAAHARAKQALIREVNRLTNAGMDHEVLTLGFARRATAYKRADLLFTDIERLRRISTQAGAIQVIYAGKAHPRDQGGKELIQRVVQAMTALGRDVRGVYLPNYDMELAAMITAGVDVWLNTPELPMEASGTSGMKAALNGVPSLSVLDGWWIEGHIEGVTGWSIGEGGEAAGGGVADWRKDAESLYQKLEQKVVPTYYEDRERWLDVMAHVIALNGSFFHTHRMIQQYVLNAYFH
jgi:starch phosphorylase